MTPAQLVNAVSAPIILFLLAVLTVALTVRLVRHILSRRTAPLLLKRDWLLFATLALSITGTQIGRVLQVRLADEVWWVLVTNGLSLLTLGVWVGIELGVIGRNGGNDASD